MRMDSGPRASWSCSVSSAAAAAEDEEAAAAAAEEEEEEEAEAEPAPEEEAALRAKGRRESGERVNEKWAGRGVGAMLYLLTSFSTGSRGRKKRGEILRRC